MLKRRWIAAVVFAVAVLILAGCSPDPSQFKPVDPNNAGVWDKYFVWPLTVALDKTYEWLGSYGLAILVVTILIRLLVLMRLRKP